MSSPIATSSTSTHRLHDHLPMIGHVVAEVALRLPGQRDLARMWNEGAMGLLVAARREDHTDATFSRLAMRTIRAHVIGSLGQDRPGPLDVELAPLLGITAQELRDARAASLPSVATAAPATPTERPSPVVSAVAPVRTALGGGRRRAAFLTAS